MKLNKAQGVAVIVGVITLIAGIAIPDPSSLFITVISGFVIYWEEQMKACSNVPDSDNTGPGDML